MQHTKQSETQLTLAEDCLEIIIHKTHEPTHTGIYNQRKQYKHQDPESEQKYTNRRMQLAIFVFQIVKRLAHANRFSLKTQK